MIKEEKSFSSGVWHVTTKYISPPYKTKHSLRYSIRISNHKITQNMFYSYPWPPVTGGQNQLTESLIKGGQEHLT